MKSTGFGIALPYFVFRLAVFLDRHFLGERQAVGVEIIQRVPQVAGQSFEMLAVRRRLVGIKPAEQVVERPVLQHQHNHMLDGRLQLLALGCKYCLHVVRRLEPASFNATDYLFRLGPCLPGRSVWPPPYTGSPNSPAA